MRTPVFETQGFCWNPKSDKCVVCGLPEGLMMNSTKEEQPREGMFLAGAMNCWEEFSHPSLSLSSIVYLDPPKTLPLSLLLCPEGGWSYL